VDVCPHHAIELVITDPGYAEDTFGRLVSAADVA
jgi:hypothetical protein